MSVYGEQLIALRRRIRKPCRRYTHIICSNEQRSYHSKTAITTLCVVLWAACCVGFFDFLVSLKGLFGPNTEVFLALKLCLYKFEAFFSNVVSSWTDREWKKYFRVSWTTFNFLCRELAPFLAKRQIVRKPLSVDQRVAMC